MRLNLLILAAIAAATLALTWGLSLRAPSPDAVSAAAEPESGMILPPFTLRTTDGETVRSADWRGRVVILNVWATWCLPCFEELPRLLAAAERHPDDVLLVLLSVDDDKAALPRFFKKLDAKSRARLDLPNVVTALDEGKAVSQDLFQTVRVPETILIGRDQRLRDKFAGAEWTAEDLAARLAALGVP